MEGPTAHRIGALGPRAGEYSTRKAGSIVGDVCCNSPEESQTKLAVSFAASRRLERGDEPMKVIFTVVSCLIVFAANAGGQQQTDPKPAEGAMCPMYDAHSQMDERGKKGMGFSQ